MLHRSGSHLQCDKFQNYKFLKPFYADLLSLFLSPGDSIIASLLGPHPALQYREGYRTAREGGGMGTRLSHLNLAMICASHATLILITIV